MKNICESFSQNFIRLLPYISHLFRQIYVFEVLVKILAKTFIFVLFYMRHLIVLKTDSLILCIQK